VLTVHDVEPRTRALMPVYERLVYPRVVSRAAKVIVHSNFAAELLREHVALPSDRLHVIPHAAPVPRVADPAAARAQLGWDTDVPIVVLPGAARSVKLVSEAIAAAVDTSWRRVIVGKPDRGVERLAAEAGVALLAAPDDRTYEAAIAACDLVLV